MSERQPDEPKCPSCGSLAHVQLQARGCVGCGKLYLPRESLEAEMRTALVDTRRWARFDSEPLRRLRDRIDALVARADGVTPGEN